MMNVSDTEMHLTELFFFGSKSINMYTLRSFAGNANPFRLKTEPLGINSYANSNHMYCQPHSSGSMPTDVNGRFGLEAQKEFTTMEPC